MKIAPPELFRRAGGTESARHLRRDLQRRLRRFDVDGLASGKHNRQHQTGYPGEGSLFASRVSMVTCTDMPGAAARNLLACRAPRCAPEYAGRF